MSVRKCKPENLLTVHLVPHSSLATSCRHNTEANDCYLELKIGLSTGVLRVPRLCCWTIPVHSSRARPLFLFTSLMALGPVHISATRERCSISFLYAGTGIKENDVTYPSKFFRETDCIECRSGYISYAVVSMYLDLCLWTSPVR